MLIDTNARFEQAVFTDSLTGYILGYSNPPQQLPLLYRTFDGGETWSRLRFPFDTTANEFPTLYAWGQHDIYLFTVSHGLIASHGGDPMWETLALPKSHFGNIYYGLSSAGSLVRFSYDLCICRSLPTPAKRITVPRTMYWQRSG